MSASVGLLILTLVCGTISLILRWLSLRKVVKNVCVVVLGDIGRSPRMQNHVISFAKEGYQVDLIGYAGSAPLKQLEDHANVNIIYMSPPPNLQERLPRIAFYFIKVLWQSVSLLTALFFKRRCGYLLIQNPPAIPTIPICWFYCTVSRAQFTIDWHNYAYTIQALSTGTDSLFVKLTRFIECFFGQGAQENLCVSEAMKADLQEQWNIRARVLYDRPSDVFHPISIAAKHSLLLKLSKTYSELKDLDSDSTMFTERSPNGDIVLKKKRPGFIVSSTSWTPDEDFSVLIAALQQYEEACQAHEQHLPNLTCFVTGKGPLKEFYTAIIKRREWQHVTVLTPWLENEDYPKILGIHDTCCEPYDKSRKKRLYLLSLASADLGICLHTSSSGLDLPMKLVDMFGSGLPALAYDYKCLNELLIHDRNGMVFRDDKELARQLISRFKNFPDPEENERDIKYRDELKAYQENRWHDNWLKNALPIFK